MAKSATLENTRFSTVKKGKTCNKMNDHAKNAAEGHRKASIGAIFAVPTYIS
jgi:hypothetical protein